MKKILPLFLVFLVACGIQAQLNKAFQGKDLAYLEQTLKMKPTQIQQLNDGTTKVVFIKQKKLAPTNISQGDASLDPITSPEVSKTEFYTFILDSEGKVLESDYEKAYEKK